MRKTKYLNIYSKKDYQRDEKKFNDSISHNEPMDYQSFQRLMLHDLCINTNIIETGYIGNYSLPAILEAIKHPNTHSRVLIEASKTLMYISPHYYRLNMFFSNMAVFSWWLDLWNVNSKVASIEKMKQSYAAVANRFEKMNIAHEFGKIMKSLPYEDVYCGVVVEDNNGDGFFFQKLDYRICKLYEIQDGLYNFAINLDAITLQKLSAYPLYIQQAWAEHIEQKNGSWYIPPVDKQICIKFNNQWTFPFPLLIGLIDDLLDINTYKKLKLQSARTDNYKAIMIKVPIDESKVDKPLLSPELLSIFAEMNKENMSDDIGLIHTLGSQGEAISFKDSSNTRNNVSDANDEIYNSAGITKELFNGSSTATAVRATIENSSAFIYGLYRQFERWCNRYIKAKKYNKQSYSFKFTLLNTTIFNIDDVAKRYKDACSLGMPVVDKWAASIGMTPSTMIGSYITHNEIFDFYNKFTPLSSSYNTSGNVGRPSNAETGEDLSDEGEKSIDADKNDM